MPLVRPPQRSFVFNLRIKNRKAWERNFQISGFNARDIEYRWEHIYHVSGRLANRPFLRDLFGPMHNERGATAALMGPGLVFTERRVADR